MLVTESIHFVDSDYRTQFRTALAGVASGNIVASEYADIQIAQGGATNEGGPGKLRIKSARLLSIENVNYKLEFYERTVPKATLASEGILGGLLGVAEFVEIGGTQPSAYYATSYQAGTVYVRVVENLDIPYWDKEGKGQLHVKLSNISSNVSKSAGDVGAVHLRVGTIIAS